MEKYTFCPQCTTRLQDKSVDNEQVRICPHCRFTHWRSPKPVVSILFSRNGKVLMLQRANEPFKGYWVLPGGFIRYDETPQQAIIRETKEEIGVTPQLGRVIGAYRIDDDPRGVHIDIIYEGSMRGEVLVSQEHLSYKFFAIVELPEKIAYKHRNAILDWSKRR